MLFVVNRFLVVLLWVFVVQGQELDSKVCDGLRGAIYSSEFETKEDPCQWSCTYNETTGRLLAQCRYDYCPSCDPTGVCGVRELQVNTVLTKAARQVVIDGGKLDSLDTYRYCIDYTEGAHSKKMVCSVVDTAAFQSECGTVATGIPMTTCNATGCECSPTSAEPDYSSPYVGFQTIDFTKCYSGSSSMSVLLSILIGAAASLFFLHL